MRIAFSILIALHGLIHLFGFFKAFGLSEFTAISQAISKTHGVFWLLAFLLFLLTFILVLTHSDYWWSSSFLAVVISQLLIFGYWPDAKFGTIANVVIVLASVIGYSNFNFNQKIKAERMRLFENSQLNAPAIVSKEALSDVPPVVQKWLTSSGLIGNELISNVHLVQELQLKLKPDQASWNDGMAEQYFTSYPPAFSWNIHTTMNRVLSIVGRDKFESGKGEMVIKLLSLIPVAHAKNDAKVNQASLQRYLAETVWFPSAALSPYIKWEAIDDFSAQAVMKYKGTEGSGVFHFDKDGNFEKFVAMRYQGSDDTEPTEWTVTATKTEKRNGIKIPVECEASWKLEAGQWTWLKLKVLDIQYNLKEFPVPKSGATQLAQKP